ncbi:MAG TPA: NfeD family protein, partial [Terriglobales bacterium]|nr:NfeD family protein [Terriglobales bacterium]
LAAVGVLSSLGGQGLVFSAVSIVSLLLFRNPLLGKMKSPAGGDAVDSLIGETAVLLDDLAPNQVGKAELRGSSWNARANDGGMLRRGQRCRVERVDGLTLWLRPE